MPSDELPPRTYQDGELFADWIGCGRRGTLERVRQVGMRLELAAGGLCMYDVTLAATGPLLPPNCRPGRTDVAHVGASCQECECEPSCQSVGALNRPRWARTAVLIRSLVAAD